MKPPQNLDSAGGIALTAKDLLPEIARRVGWTFHACAILTVQQPSELGLHGFPRQRVQCRLSVMTETGDRTEIMAERCSRWRHPQAYGGKDSPPADVLAFEVSLQLAVALQAQKCVGGVSYSPN